MAKDSHGGSAEQRGESSWLSQPGPCPLSSVDLQAFLPLRAHNPCPPSGGNNSICLMCLVRTQRDNHGVWKLRGQKVCRRAFHPLSGRDSSGKDSPRTCAGEGRGVARLRSEPRTRAPPHGHLWHSAHPCLNSLFFQDAPLLVLLSWGAVPPWPCSSATAPVSLPCLPPSSIALSPGLSPASPPASQSQPLPL